MFGPGSTTREVLRQPIYLLGGMRALLLQLADPAIATGVAEHSDFADRLFPRLRHTLDLVTIVALGTPDEAGEALDGVERIHRHVRGALPRGGRYQASDPDLKLWVLATLVDTVLEVEWRFLDEWDEEKRSRYYQESRQVMEAFGIEDAPPDLIGFRSYMGRRLNDLNVTEAALELSGHVLYPRFGPLPPAIFAPLRTITVEMLPPGLRSAYGLRYSERSRKAIAVTQTISRGVVPHLPNWLRTFPILHPVAGLRYRWKHRAASKATETSVPR